LIKKLKNKIICFSEFSRLKKVIPKEWYVQLSEEKSVKTTINIKKENIISAGRVINMDKLVNKDLPSHFRQLCRSHTTGYYQFSFYFPNILVSFLSKISWCFCVSTSKYLKSLKVSWVERLLSSKTSNWKVIPRKYLHKFGKKWLIFKMNIDNGKSIKISQFFPNSSKYFLGITFQFDVFQLSSLSTHDTLSDLK
jgi:hypothetical protein